MSNIVKYKALEKFFGKNFMLYLIWDINKKEFHQRSRVQELDINLGYGIYKTQERAERAASVSGLENYTIVDFCFKDKLPNDLIAAKELDLGDQPVIAKIRQLIIVFILRNKQIRQSLVEMYEEKNDNNRSV